MPLSRRVVVLCFAVLLLVPTLSAQTDSGDFTVIALPDTQNYADSYPQVFQAQTKWIADNRALLNIQFVVGLGDIVNNGSDLRQQQNADAAVRILDNANIPYILALGNHDYQDGTARNRLTSTYYNQFFGPNRYSSKSWYRGNYPANSNENFYAELNINGTPYLVMALEFVPRDTALAWASNIIAAHPGHKVILVTHSFLTSGGMRTGHCDVSSAEWFGIAGDNDGEEMWHKLIRKHANIVMVMNGHFHGYSRRADLGDAGNLVNQIQSDYQGWADGGGGYLRIMRFRPSLNRVDVQSYSPYYNRYLTDAANEFSVPLYNPGVRAGTGRIGGTVRTEDCTPVGGVNVSAAGVTTQTRSDGSFEMTVAPGTHSVTVSGSLWKTTSMTVKVDDNYIAQAQMFVRPAGFPDGEVIITSPAPGSTVVGPVRITGRATMQNGVRKIQAYVNDVLRGEAYGETIDLTLSLAKGGYTIVLQAADASGAVIKNVSNVVVGDQPLGSAPTVQITSPVNSSTASNEVRVIASAIPAESIGAMQLYLDDNLVYSIGTASVDKVLSVPSGSHKLVAKAWDMQGASYTSAVQFNVASQIDVLEPAQNASVSSSFYVRANVSVPDLTAVQMYLDDQLVATQTTAAVGTWLTAPPGAHRLVVQAWDRFGRVSKSHARSFNVAAPSTLAVNVISPTANATVTGAVLVDASASGPNTVSAMQVYVDDRLVYSASGSRAYSTLTLAAGTRKVVVQAWDSRGTIAKAERIVSVR